MSNFCFWLSIRAKPILSFALVLYGAIGLGLFTVRKLDSISAPITDLRDNWLPAIRTLGDVGRFSERMGVDHALLADAAGAEDRIRITTAIKTSADLADKAYQVYLETNEFDAPDIIEEERGLAARMTNARTAYDPLPAKYPDPLDHKTHRAGRGVRFPRIGGWNGSVSQRVGNRRGLPLAEVTKAGTVPSGAC